MTTIIKEEVELFTEWDELIGKTIKDIADFSFGEHMDTMFITEDNCLLHLRIENDYGDYSIEAIYYEKEYQDIYKYRGGDSYTDFLEKHNLVNIKERDVLTNAYKSREKRRKQQKINDLKREIESLKAELEKG